MESRLHWTRWDGQGLSQGFERRSRIQAVCLPQECDLYPDLSRGIFRLGW